MNILSQNIKYVFKNKLKGITQTFIDDLGDIIYKSLFDNIIEDKYLSFISSIQSFQKEFIIKIIEETLEEYDIAFKNSFLRRSNYRINKSNVPRTITTIFGEITFKRTYYECKYDGSLHFLLDEELGLKKYDKYDHIVKSIAIENAFDTNQKKSGEITGKFISSIQQLLCSSTIKTIPRQSIHNWINDWIVPNFEYPERHTPDSLFIMVDEKYLGSQDLDNDIMVKAFVAFEGVKTISKGRRKLINKFVFSTSEKSSWKSFVDILYKIYDSEKIKTIYIMSDGGNWIKAGIDELKTNPNQVLTRLLCEFHFKQAINRMTTDKDFRKILSLSFKEDDKSTFVKNVNELFLHTPEKELTICQNLNYIINNYSAIKAMVNFEIGSSMEAHISHNIAAYFGSRPKGYSSKKINKYLKINDYKNNGINIFNLYLKTFNQMEEITINEEKLNWSIFEKTNSNMPALNSSYTSNNIKYKLNYIKTANAIF